MTSPTGMSPREALIDKALMIAGTVGMMALFVGALVQKAGGL